MPQLGESVAEGTIGKWLKQVGDQVAVRVEQHQRIPARPPHGADLGAAADQPHRIKYRHLTRG